MPVQQSLFSTAFVEEADELVHGFLILFGLIFHSLTVNVYKVLLLFGKWDGPP